MYVVKHNCATWGVFNDYIMDSYMFRPVLAIFQVNVTLLVSLSYLLQLNVLSIDSMLKVIIYSHKKPQNHVLLQPSGSWDSSVSIVIRLQAGHPSNRCLVPGRSNRFLFPRVQTRSSPHTAYCSMGTRNNFLGSKTTIPWRLTLIPL